MERVSAGAGGEGLRYSSGGELLRDFHASRLEREMERLDADGTLDTPRLHALRSRHLRTPYRRTAP